MIVSLPFHAIAVKQAARLIQLVVASTSGCINMCQRTVSSIALDTAFVTDYEQWNVHPILSMLSEGGRPPEWAMDMVMGIH